MRGDHRFLAERLVSTAAAIALVAVTIGFAVHIIMSVWVPLVIIAGAIGLLIGAVQWYRRRGSSW